MRSMDADGQHCWSCPALCKRRREGEHLVPGKPQHPPRCIALLQNCMDDGRVLYNKFLGQFRVEVKPEYSQWKNQVTKRVHDALLAADLNLQEMVNVFDHNQDGMLRPWSTFGGMQSAVSRSSEGLAAQACVPSPPGDSTLQRCTGSWPLEGPTWAQVHGVPPSW